MFENKILRLLFLSAYGVGLMVVVLATASIFPVAAEGYPNKTIRLIIPYPPGGGSDIVARPLLQLMSASMGQPMIVENKGGAGGNIGMELVAKSPPDGYTLVLGITAQLAVNPSLYPKLNYDLLKDFSPIGQLGIAPYVLVVHPTLPVKNVREMLMIAKTHPLQLRFGSAGNGSGAHLAGGMLDSMAKVKTAHIPYKGGALAMTDLVAGQLQFSFLTYTSSSAFIKSHRLKALAVTTAQRSKALPDLPAIGETVPGYDSSVWYGVLAPAGTASEIVNKLNHEFLLALNNLEFRNRLILEAFEPMGSTPAQLGALMKSEIQRWAKLVKETNTRID